MDFNSFSEIFYQMRKINALHGYHTGNRKIYILMIKRENAETEAK